MVRGRLQQPHQSAPKCWRWPGPAHCLAALRRLECDAVHPMGAFDRSRKRKNMFEDDSSEDDTHAKKRAPVDSSDEERP